MWDTKETKKLVDEFYAEQKFVKVETGDFSPNSRPIPDDSRSIGVDMMRDTTADSIAISSLSTHEKGVEMECIGQENVSVMQRNITRDGGGLNELVAVSQSPSFLVKSQGKSPATVVSNSLSPQCKKHTTRTRWTHQNLTKDLKPS
eukprot:TRINITY_DN7066_c0_g1_i1.p1 TRINITY_DN7066_c0_g1~~TRINITY_DN7066_c0_g1_i1.p1  ORF type:complete len:146 (-),score=25.47 TRINITY_DN7066_c0_g1_i1:65-502(-)